jgi:hypothetical protein
MTTTVICNSITDELRETLASRVLTWPHPGDSCDIVPLDGRGRYNVIVCLADMFLTKELLDGLAKNGASIVEQTLELTPYMTCPMPPVLIDETGETPVTNKESDMTASENILKVLDDEPAELSKGGYAADQFGEDEGGA